MSYQINVNKFLSTCKNKKVSISYICFLLGIQEVTFMNWLKDSVLPDWAYHKCLSILQCGKSDICDCEE